MVSFGLLTPPDPQDYVRASTGIHEVLTYADNLAIGYFEKQGFTSEITLEEKKWSHAIGTYLGAMLMQCSMHPRTDYVDDS